MTLGKTIAARLGLFSRKKPAGRAATDAPDTFDLRLQRIGTREGRLPARQVLFRTRSEPLAASAL